MELSAFDLDHTLIKGSCGRAFCRYLYKKKVIPFSMILHSLVYVLRHRLFGMTLQQLHESVFNHLLKDRPFLNLESHVETFVEEYLTTDLYIPAYARLKRAQQLGHYTVIMSNSPSFLVKVFAKKLGVNDYYASEYVMDGKHRIKGIKKILEGKDKAKQLLKMAKKLGLFLEEITAYSDSFLDLEFLEAAGNAIAVNPDKKLLAISKKNQWSVI